MIYYLEELKDILDRYGIKASDIVVVGSSTITDTGLRKNSDIEFCCNRRAYRKIPLKAKLWLLISDHYDISKNVDVFRERYLNIGVHDKDIFKEKLYTSRYGYQIVKPEVEYCYKERRNWDKDIDDLKRLQQEPYNRYFNHEFIEFIRARKIQHFDRVYEWFRIGMGWRLAKLESMLSSHRRTSQNVKR